MFIQNYFIIVSVLNVCFIMINNYVINGRESKWSRIYSLSLYFNKKVITNKLALHSCVCPFILQNCSDSSERLPETLDIGDVPEPGAGIELPSHETGPSTSGVSGPTVVI